MSAATLDRVGDTIDAKAYYSAIKDTDKIIALFNHCPDKICGFWSDLKVKGDTLVGSIKLFHKDWGAMVKEMLDFGIPLGASIGFQGEGEHSDTGIKFTSIKLLETSIVATPCHPRAMEIPKSYGVDLKSIDGSDTYLDGMSAIDKDPESIIRKAKLVILEVNKLKIKVVSK